MLRRSAAGPIFFRISLGIVGLTVGRFGVNAAVWNLSPELLLEGEAVLSSSRLEGPGRGDCAAENLQYLSCRSSFFFTADRTPISLVELITLSQWFCRKSLSTSIIRCGQK